MILRRISQHLKDQNWTAIVLDFFIVVIGVYVGIQADNWNESRKETALERNYLERLHQDVKDSIAINDIQVEFMQGHGNQASLVLSSLKACSIQEQDKNDFANGLFHLGKIYTVPMVRRTIDELIATGRMYTIHNIDIRTQLDKTLARYEEIASLNPDIINRINPHVVYVDTKVVYRITKPILGNNVLSWEDIEMDLELLCHDQRFFTAVAAVRNYTFDVIAQNQSVLAEIEKLGNLLQEELSEE